MLRKNDTKGKVKAGKTVVGFRMDFVSPYVVEVMGNIGFDFVYFDCEHGPMSEEACEEMIRATELVGLTPLVRVPSSEPGVILRFLDSGAMGVIIPHCYSKQVTQAAVKAVKYPPEGERGIAGRSLSLSGKSVPDYIREANQETMVIVMIEDAEGVKNISEIVSVDGLDVLFIGRLDLSVSMGIPGQVDHPKIKEAVEKVITQARAAGKAVGVGAIDIGKPESIKQFSNQGAQFFSLNAASILTSASRDLLKKIRGG
jgi:4-hydroxy-2-oxoheptanedioate aldolase